MKSRVSLVCQECAAKVAAVSKCLIAGGNVLRPAKGTAKNIPPENGGAETVELTCSFCGRIHSRKAKCTKCKNKKCSAVCL